MWDCYDVGLLRRWATLDCLDVLDCLLGPVVAVGHHLTGMGRGWLSILSVYLRLHPRLCACAQENADSQLRPGSAYLFTVWISSGPEKAVQLTCGCSDDNKPG